MNRLPLVRYARGALFASTLALIACAGEIGGRADPGAPPRPPRTADMPAPAAPAAPGVSRDVVDLVVPSACAAAALYPGPSPLRRLTRHEYDRTVADLLGDASGPAAAFPPEEHAHGFDNNADLARPSVLLVEQYELVAERLARQATVDLPNLMGCTPATAAAEEPCARQFLESFGLRAFRRPLARDELDRHLGFYATNRAKHGFAAAVRMMVQAILQSPAFLYRLEGTGALASSAVVVKATPWELASRLSYLLWSSMPDRALFDAAAAGRLATAADVAREARRMLDDPKAKHGVRSFFAQWLELANVDVLTKDARIYPAWSQRIAGLLRRETETFLEEAILQDGGGLTALLRAEHTYADRELATYYGLRGPAGAAFEKVAIDPTRRSGVLTHGALLASLASATQSSPVKRGYFLRDRLLCAPPPPAPANLDAKVPEPDGRSTTRERFAAHRADPGCASCHALMDPLGLGLENFDGIGLWRDRDAGRAIDAAGEVKATRDADGPFVGAVELGTRLAGSGQVRDCLARQYFRFAFGRAEQDGDACALEALATTLAGGGSVRALLVGLTQTDAFLTRTVDAGGAL